MNKAAYDNLIGARTLLARPYGWGQGAFEKRVKYGDEIINQFCAIGAIREVDGAGEVEAIATLTKSLGFEESVKVIYWNDTPGRLKKEVLKAFDRAIELASNESSL